MTVTLTPVTATSLTEPTATEVIAEGQLQYTYFPTCASVANLYTEIGRWSARAEARITKQVGATRMATTDATDIQQLHDCWLYLTVAYAWAVILNVMLAYDNEDLPPEYVEPDKCAAQRDYYLDQANQILNQYDASPGVKAYIGSFSAEGIDGPDVDPENVGPLGLSY